MHERDICKFLRQLLFIDWHVSSFWFIAAIMICYFIYPFLEMLMRKGKRKWIIRITASYIAFLCLFRFLQSDLFSFYEVLWTRIPIFIIGSYFSEKVHNNQEVTLKEFGGYVLMIFLKSPFVFAISRIPFIGELSEIFSRLLLGWMGIGIIFVMLFLIKAYENSVINIWITKIGAYTLEIYVFHIALRYVMIYICHLANVELTAYRQIVPFGIVFIPLSVMGGYCLGLFMNRVFLNIKKTTEKQCL